jgi:hypothetical protein
MSICQTCFKFENNCKKSDFIVQVMASYQDSVRVPMRDVKAMSVINYCVKGRLPPLIANRAIDCKFY